MSPQKVFAGSLVLAGTLLLLGLLTGTLYADNRSQSFPTDGRQLTIVADYISGPIAPGDFVTLTGRVALGPLAPFTDSLSAAISAPLSAVPTDTQATATHHVEVRVDQAAPITATLDAVGKWRAPIPLCTMPSRVAATAVAADGTRATAEFILCGPPVLPDTGEPTPPLRLYLPVIGVQ